MSTELHANFNDLAALAKRCGMSDVSDETMSSFTKGVEEFNKIDNTLEITFGGFADKKFKVGLEEKNGHLSANFLLIGEATTETILKRRPRIKINGEIENVQDIIIGPFGIYIGGTDKSGSSIKLSVDFPPTQHAIKIKAGEIQLSYSF